MTTALTAAQRRALGDFIRAQRSKLPPAAVGLPAGARRRTPGLRREEVAQLGGMSATWYTWIEQGRDVSVSPAALARLARTLRLSAAERRYLFDLAGKRDPSEPAEPDDIGVPSAVVASLAAMALPAYLLDGRWRARAWNAPAARLFVGWLDGPHDRNLLRYIFLTAEARTLICDWEHRARRVVAEFRADCSRHLEDPALAALLDELRRRSAFFAQLWDEHAVLGREGGERTFSHPQDGFLRYEQISFTLANRPELKLVMLATMAQTKD
jgi:transcriptional regulator with XRE-family HTH domain